MKRVFLAIILLSFLVGTGSQVFAETPEEFFNGKVITMLVPYNPGSGSDTYARMMMGYVQQAIPGVSVGIKNQADAGGLVAKNEFYNVVKPDGLTIMISPTGGLWPAAMLGDPSVKYEIDKYQYLGGIIGGEFAVTVASKGKYASVDALKKGKGVKFGGSSPAALTSLASIAAIEVLGLDGKCITGYSGSSARTLALLQGELDAITTSVEVAEGYRKSGMDTQTLLVIGTKRSVNFPDIPCIADVTELSDHQKLVLGAIFQESRAWCVPPGTPEDRVQFLRDTFKKILESKEFIRTAKRFMGDEWLGTWTGDVIQQQTVEIQKHQKELVKVYADLIKKHVK